MRTSKVFVRVQILPHASHPNVVWRGVCDELDQEKGLFSFYCKLPKLLKAVTRNDAAVPNRRAQEAADKTE